MKAYTDVEQSMKLDKILPKDSYDMYLSRIDDGRIYIPHFGKTIIIDENMFSYRNGYVVPCWSLAALLEIMPVTIKRANNIYRLRMDKSEEDFNIWYEDIDSGLVQSDLDIIAPNIVDACVEMIVKNYEQNKERLQKEQEME